MWKRFEATKDQRAIEVQRDALDVAVTPAAGNAHDYVQSLYCLPYLDMKHEEIMWYCWTQLDAAKAYFLTLRKRPPTKPDRETWTVTTYNLLENVARPPMLLKLPQLKVKGSMPSK